MWVQTGNCENWIGTTADCTLSETGGSNEGVQSIELGWINGNGTIYSNPVLFAFTTTEAYSPAHSWYAYDPSGPYQIAPGATYMLNATSPTPIGPSVTSISLEVFYSGSSWWIIVNGTISGSYLGSAYQGGRGTYAPDWTGLSQMGSGTATSPFKVLAA
jgi:hypothetical protein